MENHEEVNLNDSATESIFNGEEFSTEGYDKNIRHARNILFILAALELCMGIFFLFSVGGQAAWISFGITTLVAIIFFILGIYTKAKPYNAILYGLIVYIMLWIGDAIFDPTYIYKGILLKIIIIVYMAKRLKDAKEAQLIKSIMKK